MKKKKERDHGRNFLRNYSHCHFFLFIFIIFMIFFLVTRKNSVYVKAFSAHRNLELYKFWDLNNNKKNTIHDHDNFSKLKRSMPFFLN